MFWKINLDVPKGIRYLSDWSEFDLNRFKGHNILHKQIPGCGLTEYALRCNYPVVLCSPRKMLMENKKDQHGDDVYLVVSQFDRQLDIDSDISKIKTESEIRKDVEAEEFLKKLKQDTEQDFYSTLFHEIQQYMNSLEVGKYPKIIVTYDSSYLVKRVLEQMNLLDNFWFIVDEFQSLLEDARFKADTELSFLNNVAPFVKNVLFASATPMLDKYIDQIPQLNLPYYQLDWGKLDPTRIKKPDLKVRSINSITTKMQEIVQSYLEGKFEKVVVEREDQLIEVESKECVIYVNSVNHIINIIKKLNLSPEQVNILCSDTPDNQRKIDKKLGKGRYQIGKVPLRGEPHKLITFCTRTVYLGADFYSLCARSFIFSDSNSDCLSVDISMDLAQILGRQRLEENPWKNTAEFYYRSTCDYKKMTEEDFQKIIKEKELATNDLIDAYNSAPDHTKKTLVKNYQFIVKSLRYRENYMAINKNELGELIPSLNILVRINDNRSFDIQQVDYRDRFSVFCSIKNQFSSVGNEGDIIFDFFSRYDQLTTYVEKIHMIVDYLLQNPENKDIIIGNLSDSDKIKQQLISLGAERIKSLGYNLTKINKDMGIVIFNREELNKVIYNEFLVGQRYTKKYIKGRLGEIYKACDFNGKAKANHLEEWFEVKTCKVALPDGTRPDGFEIIKQK